MTAASLWSVQWWEPLALFIIVLGTAVLIGRRDDRRRQAGIDARIRDRYRTW